MSPAGIPSAKREAAIHELLSRLVIRFGGAVEFWTVVCLSQRDLGDPGLYVAEQWQELYSDMQTLRSLIGQGENPSHLVQEQVMKLIKTCTDLRDVFDQFLDCGSVPLKDLELAVHRLDSIWHEVKLRVSFLAALIPLPPPLPRLSSEQDAYYQAILDGMFDRFATARPISLSERNGTGEE